MTVLLLAVTVSKIIPREQIILDVCTGLKQTELTLEAALEPEDPLAPWHEKSPYKEVVLGVRAVVPLIGFLMATNNYIQRKARTPAPPS